MTMLGFLLSSPTLIAIIGGVLAALVAFLRGNSRGVRREREIQAKAEQKARDIADEVQSDVGAMSRDQLRAELAKRTRP
ncbi:hypothetical protein EDC40_101135 [Aminobacter aminovorans]|jgi:uncharacterized membrane protein YgaE (UPF0421/DUF939 family)|uniref:ABC transporter permease n=1 Tax=Aminobacter aminovorans TaxID=83263 RepID=A0A380WNW2_AMIAI|nr:hypothetical protein [Aminobacter aminovorans]TCS29820.1 hypothetical protein EDC40_101135 [Aminobacter aminovorans]SUU90669.1 Uncharacterised protein [Aminobacter aminovorans]